ncbi:MAG: ArnT family glycosyltransferase [Phycisphaerae bacterium]
MLAVGATALAVRLLFCFVAVPGLGLATGPSRPDFYSSTDGYWAIGVNLVEHRTFAFTPAARATTYRAPVYPAALAAGYWLVHDAGAAVLLVNCVASALTCMAVYGIAVLLIGSRATYATMLPVTFFPLSIYYCASSFSDTVVALTIALYVYALLLLVRAPTIGRGVMSGVAFAVAALTKAVVLPLPLLVCGFALFRRRAALRPSAVSMLVGITLVGLWTIRNYAVSGRFVPVTGGTGYNMLVGNFMIDAGSDCDSSLAYGRAEARRLVRRSAGSPITTEIIRPHGFLDVPPEIDQLYGRSALRMFVADPGLAVRKLAINAVRFWYFSSSPAKSLANGLVNFAVLLLAALAFPRIARIRRTEVELLLLVLTAIVGAYAIIIVHSSRFCLPVVLPLLPIAAIGAAELRQKWPLPKRALGVEHVTE